ncbi:hypothetical protein EDB19DRAFT_1918745 [Suillus lakei]|nr:hypothetical protein EDB19DRAFT_1918745 [Suillus lakei]
METDESLYSSEASTLVNVRHTCFNFGMSLPMAQPPLVLRLNLGMDIDILAAPSALPPKPYNLGMNLNIPGTVPPSSLAVHTQQPFNLGFPLPAQQLAPMPFNLGFNRPGQTMGTPPPTMLPSNMPLPTTSNPYNLGFGLPMAVTPPATHSGQVPAQETMNVGYGLNNMSFQFECEHPSPIGEWQPELIRVLQPLLPVASPPVASLPSVAPLPSVAFLPPAMADAVPGPSSVPCPLPHTGRHLKWPTLKSLVGDAKCAAIEIVNRLGGQEFDHLAQMMVGGALGPGDDVWDPKPDEVLETNRVILMAFLESRDQLTRVFKDLISLHNPMKRQHPASTNNPKIRVNLPTATIPLARSTNVFEVIDLPIEEADEEDNDVFYDLPDEEEFYDCD